MVICHDYWHLCWVSRYSLRTQVHESKGTRRCSLVYGLESELGVILTYTLKFSLAGTQGRESDSPIDANKVL